MENSHEGVQNPSHCSSVNGQNESSCDDEVSIVTDKTHVKGCSWKYAGYCVCKTVISLEQRRARRAGATPHQDNSQSNSSTQSSILAGQYAEVPSINSSDTSFYSTQTNMIESKDNSNSKSSTESNYSTDRWNKNIDSSSKVSKDTIDVQPTETTTRDSNHNLGTTNSSIDSTRYQSLVSRIKNTAKVSGSSFLQKLLEEIETPGQPEEKKFSGFISRMSQSYNENSNHFKDKLMTILEETTLKDDRADCSGFELGILAKQFAAQCKYIHDESMPSMMVKSPTNQSGFENTIEKIRNASHLSGIPEVADFDINFSTPKQSPGRINKVYRKTPLNAIQTFSPLCKATLTRAGTPTTPQSQRAPGTPSTPGSADSFIRNERYCKQNETPNSTNRNLRRSISSPNIALSDKKKILKICEEQYKSLDDSVIDVGPRSQLQNDPDTSRFETFDSHPNFLQTSDEYHSMSSTISDDLDDLTKTIMIEVAKKRQRCYETEKTMREIDAASNTSSEPSEMLDFLNKCEDYYQCLNENKSKIREVTKKLSRKSFDSGVDMSSRFSKRKSANTEVKEIRTQKSGNYLKPTNLVTPCRISPELKLRSQTPRSVSSSKLQIAVPSSTPCNIKYSRSNSSSGSISSTSLSSRNSSKSSISMSRNQSPRPKSRTNLKAKLTPYKPRDRSVSPIVTIPKRSSSKKSTAIVSSNFLTVPSHTVRSSNSSPSSQSKSSASKARKQSPRRPESTYLKIRMSPRKSRDRSISPIATLPRSSSAMSAAIISSRLLGIQSPALTRSTSMKNVPKVTVTPLSGSSKRTPRSSCKTTPVTTTPISHRTPLQRRFFITPKKSSPSTTSSASKPTTKPRSYFTGFSDPYHALDTVRSPVGEYMRSTDTQLVQNIRGKTNNFLLTPKSKANTVSSSSEDLKFRLTKNEHIPINFGTYSPILEHQAQMNQVENQENTPENYCNLPKTTYKMPSDVHEIVGSPSRSGGPRARLLQQASQAKLVTRHEGRVIPYPLDSSDSDLQEMSIHVTNLASKTNFVSRFVRGKD